MDLPTLLDSLGVHAERLLDRHLKSARDWYPHELVPWSRGRDFVDGERWSDQDWPLEPRLRSALVLNLLTEDGLPYYVVGIHDLLGECSPWFDWLRRWTAEEMRHATVIRDYLIVTRAVDPILLEQARMQYCTNAEIPSAPNAIEAFVYLTMQELATRIAHWRTGELLPDPEGQRLMRRIAADENLHHLFYRDLVAVALELAPSEVTIAIDNQIRHFKMPGHSIPEFNALAADVAAAGIYSLTDYVDEIVEPLVSTHWVCADSALSPNALAARRRTTDFIQRTRRIAQRL
jgi:acyl-[acyl-carrier-protein] desaturase